MRLADRHGVGHVEGPLEVRRGDCYFPLTVINRNFSCCSVLSDEVLIAEDACELIIDSGDHGHARQQLHRLGVLVVWGLLEDQRLLLLLVHYPVHHDVVDLDPLLVGEGEVPFCVGGAEGGLGDGGDVFGRQHVKERGVGPPAPGQTQALGVTDLAQRHRVLVVAMREPVLDGPAAERSHPPWQA